MKKQFQSKAVPRGTRTIWRYLSALFLLLTFAIGNVWAADYLINVESGNLSSDNKWYQIADVGGVTNKTGSTWSSADISCSPVGAKIGSSNFTVRTDLANTTQITVVASSGSNRTIGNVKTGASVSSLSDATGCTKSGSVAKNTCDQVLTFTFDPALAAGTYVNIAMSGNMNVHSVTITAGDSGEEPVCPSGLTISSKDSKTAFLEGDKIELTATLSEGNGTISYQWYKGSVASGNEISGGNKAKLEIASCVEGDAGNYYCVASKSECSDAVNADAFTITVAHNPCTTHHWFVATADATANSVTNWNGFTNAVTGSSGQTNSVTIDGTTYNLTKRTGSTGGGGTILGFTIPANKAGTLYGYMKSSGSAARILSLKKGDDVIKTNTEIVDGAWTLITIDAIAPGTYTLSPDQNVQVQMFVLKICDATFRTITLDLNGGTGETSISALDGAPATKPADPTKDHFRFDGWYNGADAYDWSANVTGDLTLTAHWTQLYTVSFQAGEGSGDAPAAVADKAEGETFVVPANTFTAPASKEFDKWNDGTNDYAPGATYTVGTANVVLTAQWKAAVAKYSVIFKDGETELGTKLFDIGSNPSDADIDKTKPLFAFAAWQLSGSDIALDDASWASLAANAEVTLTARWTKLYASSVDLEGLVESEGVTADWQAYLSNHGFAFSTSNVSLDAKNPDKTYANWPYQGLKAKEVGAYVEGNINAGKLVIIKLGHMAAAADVLIGGEPAGTATGLDAAEPEGQLNYFYVENEALLHYETTNAGACILKAITIQDPFEVSFDVNGGDAAIAAMHGTPSITLPNATKGTDNFAGWYDALDNFIGNAGASYTPSADIQLVAHWETLSTDNTLSDLKVDGVTVEGFSPDVHTYYIVLPYGTDVSNLPKITLATPNNANASVAIWPVDGPAWTDDFGGCYRQQANVTPQDPDAAVGYNDIRITVAPKDGVSIIKVATTGGTNKTVTGLYAGEGDVNLSSSKKMDNGKYIGFTLAGTTLQVGDQINVHTTQAANTGGSHIIFYDNMTDKNELYETGEIGGQGDNIFTINAAMVGQASAYVYRSNTDAAHQWNGYVDFIEVTRPMNPVLTAISIDGRAGELDMSAANHFNVLIPYESDLANLTIVPEIVWNAPAADNSIVVNDGGAWIIGDNTYKLTDKDGDFTVYTIKLTRDVLKHTVSFNTHGGSAVASVEVEHNAYLTAVPNEPSKEDYIFKHWSLNEGGEEVDITTVQITADKEFHAVWAPDGAIKLIVDGENPGEKVINHTNFITGAAMASSKVTVEEVEYNYAQLGGTASTPSGQNQLNKFIAYNATTTQTKVMVNVYNNSTNARSVVIKGVVEGSTEVVDLATINLDNGDNKHVKSAYYEFNNAANRTIYISVPNTVASIDFLQVKVIESGEPLKMFGENGYSINLNKGRLFGPSATDLKFEGMTYNLGSNYNALSSTIAVFKKNTSYQIDVPAAVTMTLTTSASKFYVSQAADGTDNETAADGAHDFDLTAGTWFINVAGSNLNVTNIAFSAPKCEKPEFTALANSELCEGDAFVALNGTATVTDGGTITYQWYNEDDSAIEGAINATFTPSADGKYYVIATNSLADHADNFNKSDLVTVAHLAGTIITSAPADVRKDAGAAATLTVVAEGKNLAYEWFTCDEDGANAVAVDPAATEASLEVTVPSGVQYYKVVVTGDCGDPVEAIVKVEEWTELEQVSVSETTVWDWVNVGENNKLVEGKNVEILMANIRENDVIPTNDATFNSQALLFYGENVRAVDGGRAYASIGHISFTTTVPGVVVVEFSNNKKTSDNQPRRVSINGKQSETSLGTNDVKTFMAVVPAGEVVITGVNEAGTSSNQYIRISKITFSTVDYTREVTAGRYGTICLPNSGKMYGAALYEVAYLDASAKKIYFDEVLNGEMVAGMPYIFLPNSGVDLLAVAYTDEANAPAGDMNGLYGSYTQQLLAKDAGNYILLNNQYLEVNSDEVYVGANRAYLKIGVSGGVPTTAVAPVPGRRRIAMGVTSEKVATGIDNLNANEQSMKVIIDGQLFILRGEQMFDATGRLVK